MLRKPNSSVSLELETLLISSSHLAISLQRPMRQNTKASGCCLLNFRGTAIRNPHVRLFRVILTNIGLSKYIIIRAQLDSATGVKCVATCFPIALIKVHLKFNTNVMQT
ncbi:unnamed protein product [Litomosoides sigmodontis]|uniref:Uncharacterized protein n=1 Tax=Litomosoides sigmodontis TaxID=42156 RepID=A0A3P6UQL2_LITSI|nr:unnamed protein product [Litomosoides sigmodontis]